MRFRQMPAAAGDDDVSATTQTGTQTPAAERLFAVQAFKADGFSLVAQAPQRCDSEREARNLAARLFKTYPAVVAWSVPDAGKDSPPGAKPEILLRIGRVPEPLSFTTPAPQPKIDLLDELTYAAEHPETLPRAELQALFRRAAREIATFRRQAGAGHAPS